MTSGTRRRFLALGPLRPPPSWRATARKHENGAGALAPAPPLSGQPSKRLAFLASVFWYWTPASPTFACSS